MSDLLPLGRCKQHSQRALVFASSVTRLLELPTAEIELSSRQIELFHTCHGSLSQNLLQHLWVVILQLGKGQIKRSVDGRYVDLCCSVDQVTKSTVGLTASSPLQIPTGVIYHILRTLDPDRYSSAAWALYMKETRIRESVRNSSRRNVIQTLLPWENSLKCTRNLNRSAAPHISGCSFLLQLCTRVR